MKDARMIEMAIMVNREGRNMLSFRRKSRGLARALHGGQPQALLTRLASYAAEYRRAMHAARQVEIMAGHLDRAARLIKQDYQKHDA